MGGKNPGAGPWIGRGCLTKKENKTRAIFEKAWGSGLLQKLEASLAAVYWERKQVPNRGGQIVEGNGRLPPEEISGLAWKGRGSIVLEKRDRAVGTWGGVPQSIEGREKEGKSTRGKPNVVMEGMTSFHKEKRGGK